MKPIALEKIVFVGEKVPTNAFHELVWAAELESGKPPDIYCNWCHKKWHRWVVKGGYKSRWLSRPCSARSSE